MTLDGLLITFNLFPQLPVELQRKIWHYTLPGPRIIRVHRHTDRDGAFCFDNARPPAALHTCQTSREVACSVFETAFIHDNTNTDKALTPIYIDFAHDTIYLATPCDLLTAPYEALARIFPDTQKIQSLAVEVSSPGAIEMALAYIVLPSMKIEGDLGGDLEEIAVKIGDLREIVVVVGHQSYSLHKVKYLENIRFSEPEARPWSPWQTWKDIEAHWTEQLLGWERGVVRFKEVKIV